MTVATRNVWDFETIGIEIVNPWRRCEREDRSLRVARKNFTKALQWFESGLYPIAINNGCCSVFPGYFDVGLLLYAGRLWLSLITIVR